MILKIFDYDEIDIARLLNKKEKEKKGIMNLFKK